MYMPPNSHSSKHLPRNLSFDGTDFPVVIDFNFKVCVKMKNLENGTEFIWTKEKFLNRLYLMKEMYSNYEEEEDDWDLPEVFT